MHIKGPDEADEEEEEEEARRESCCNTLECIYASTRTNATTSQDIKYDGFWVQLKVLFFFPSPQKKSPAQPKVGGIGTGEAGWSRRGVGGEEISKIWQDPTVCWDDHNIIFPMAFL